MKLATQVVLALARLCWMGPSSPSFKGPEPPPNFRSIFVMAKWLDGLRCPWDFVSWGPSLPLQKAAEPPPRFSADVYCGQTCGWIKMALGMEVGLSPGHIVLGGDPAAVPQKGGRAPNFRPIFVAKRLDTSRCHLVWK